MNQYIDMPRLGLGTWQLTDQQASDTVALALQMGYRHIDTAPRYENEVAVGLGLQQSGVARKEVFVTTKIWYDQLAPEAMRRSAATSLDKLQLDHVDLLLIHWPNPDSAWDMAASLETLLALKQQGWAKNIGVANFPVALLQQAWGILGEELKVNQVEYHFALQQQALLDFTQKHNMLLTAYSPLARGDFNEHPVLLAIAAKHGANVGQIALAWLLRQDGVAAIPKASSVAHLQSNLQAASIELDAEDLAQLQAIPKNQRLINPDFAPQWTHDAVIDRPLCGLLCFM